MIRKTFLSVILLSLLLFSLSVHAQKYDLVVTAKGDSIACHIDSISSSSIYFEMKTNGRWVHTSIGLDMISLYEQDTIGKKDYIFKPGTSTIESAMEDIELQKNSVYLGIGTLCYGRTYPGYPVGFAFGIGIASPDGFAFYAEATMLFGRNKHYLETGLSTAVIPFGGKPEFLGPIFRFGYRYQGPRGFLFRSAPTLGFIDGDIIPLPALSIGYSF